MNCEDRDGVRIIALSSWNEFHESILGVESKSKRGYMWRGQQKDEDQGWLLRSKFDRTVKSKNEVDRTKKLQDHLDNFKQEMNKSCPNVLPQDDVDIWALGQHYGLKTPLLDWTPSPYIAAYFAFEEWCDPEDQDDRYRYV